MKQSNAVGMTRLSEGYSSLIEKISKQKQNPHITERYRRFAEELDSLMSSYVQAVDEERINDLYKRYNPNLAEELDNDEEDDDEEVKIIKNVFEDNYVNLVQSASKNISPEMINEKTQLEIAALTAFMTKQTYAYSKGFSENVINQFNEAFGSILEIIDNNCFDHLEHPSKEGRLKFIKNLIKL